MARSPAPTAPLPAQEADSPATADIRELTELEHGVIDIFVRLADILGVPKSVGEIYGLLFASARPLAFQEISDRLEMSKGSASQGLKYLEELGAVRTVYVAGERRTHYEAVAELRNLAGRFLSQQILTHFKDSASRLDRLAMQAQKLSTDQRKHVNARVKLLRSWQRNGRRVVPFVLKMLGAGT